jgi:cytoskeletal protein CcmA (bactofilin family)
MAQQGTRARAHSHSDSHGTTVIGEGTHVRGRVQGDGNLSVEGRLEGDITLRGRLVIGGGARVTSNVEAESVTIEGTLEGDIHARGAVHIASGSRVKGDVHGEQVSLEEGAAFAGRLDCAFELPPELLGGPSERPRGGASSGDAGKRR